MATNTNAPVGVTLGPATGIKIGNIFKWVAALHVSGVFRGFGGPTAPSSISPAHTSSPHMHLAVAETYDDAWAPGSGTVTTTAGRIDNLKIGGAAVLTNRKANVVRNTGGVSMFVAQDNTVTAAGGNKGLEIRAGESFTFPFGENLQIWAIVASGTTGVDNCQFA